MNIYIIYIYIYIYIYINFVKTSLMHIELRSNALVIQ